MNAVRPVAHIISNAEVTLTECDRILNAIPGSVDPRPYPLVGGGSDVAVWDDVDTPAGFDACKPCSDAYGER